MGRQHYGMNRPGVRQAPEGSGEQGEMEKTGCEIICGAQTTLAVKGYMMVMMVDYIRRTIIVGCPDTTSLFFVCFFFFFCLFFFFLSFFLCN